MGRLILYLLLVVGGGVCFGAATPPGGGGGPAKRLQISTSILPVYCFTVNIVSNLADVSMLLEKKSGPHDYQFSPQDLKKLSSADVIVLNGLGLESWLDRAFKNLERKPVVIEAAAGLKQELITEVTSLDEGHDHAHHHGPNPHIWLDPQLAIYCVETITAGLKRADPVNAEAYERNAKAYVARLHKLDEELAANLKSLQNKPFITFHDAFPYLTRRYSLQLAGVLEQVPDVQPTQKYLRQLRAKVQKHGVKVIFTEPQFPSRLARQLAADLKMQIAELDPLETGTAKPEAYEEGMRHNARKLAAALK